MMALATKVYEEAAKQAQANEANAESNNANDDKNDNVKDAEFEEK